MASIFENLLARGITNLVWEDMCREIATNDSLSHIRPKGTKDSGFEVTSSELWMTNQLLTHLRSFSEPQINVDKHKIINYMVRVLRPEDVTNTPQLRIDHESGVIIDWNRSMTDLTGVARSEVLGKTYKSMLREWVPLISEKYYNAAIKWMLWPEDNPMDEDDDDERWPDDPDLLREMYLFPLPLPLKSSAKKSDKDNNKCDFVELLVVKASEFKDIRYCVPQRSYRDMPDQHYNLEGWIGGLEFTLRRVRNVPSLQSLCHAIIPQNVVGADGSILASLKSTKNQDLIENKDNEKDDFDEISAQISSNRPEVLAYLRVVLYHIRMAFRKNLKVGNKIFRFSDDWSKNAKTSELNKIIFKFLGGDRILQQNVKSGKMIWRMAFLLGGSKMSREDRMLAEEKRRSGEKVWKYFLQRLCPILGEHSYPICKGSDAPYIIPGIEHPNRVMLTLKIEALDAPDEIKENKERTLRAWAVVRVPASLNFFQLHRVVCQTMHCDNTCARETHQWIATNIGSLDNNDFESSIAYGGYNFVQIGENYDVDFEDGVRHDEYESGYFKKGKAIRQRVSYTAAYYDHAVPLCDYKKLIEGCKFVDKLHACIHSTCISAIFYQPGAIAHLEDGFHDRSTDYKVSCLRIDEYNSSLPDNHNINIMLPKCLRGDSDENFNPDWSVDGANSQLELDRGCLRRNFCQLNSNDCMQQIPWCYNSNDWWSVVNAPSEPLATRLCGANLESLFFYGEPPLPGFSSIHSYAKYVSSLDARIKPSFLQENVIDMHNFHVPFRKGKKGYKRQDCSGRALGAKWEIELDEEMRQISNAQSNLKKAGGKKRKRTPHKSR